jgi:uncharacterized protein YbjT (DUF2867 family)
MRVVVVGATGFVGRELIERLASEGHEVVGASRRPREAAAAKPEVTWVETGAPEMVDAIAATGSVVNLAFQHHTLEAAFASLQPRSRAVYPTR